MLTVALDWTGQQSFVVRLTDDAIHVLAQPELSELQVMAACDLLGESGQDVLAAWRRAVGLNRAS